MGNIKTLTAPSGTDQFRYDKHSRLVETRLNSISAPIQTYTFDDLGNITAVTTGGTTENFPVQGTTNRLSSTIASYDAGGNLLSWNGNGYGFDPLNMMTDLCTSGTLASCAGERWSYVYTADDERLWSVKSDNRQIWTPRSLANQVLTHDERTPAFEGGLMGGEEFVPMGTAPTRVIKDYVYRGDQRVGFRQLPNGSPQHFGLDHLGTVRAIITGAGVLQATHTYYPFGREASSTAADAEPMKFTGHERDLHVSASATADDLDYLHARFSTPVAARFLAVDPAVFHTASTTPQDWNRYSYALGNPLVFTDPDGRTAVAAIWTASGSTAAGAAAAAAGAVAFAGGSGWFAGRTLGELEVGGQSINAHASDGMSTLILWMGSIVKSPSSGDFVDADTGEVVLPAPLPPDVLIPGTLDLRGNAAEAAEAQKVHDDLTKATLAEEPGEAVEAVAERVLDWAQRALRRWRKADKEKTSRDADEEAQNGE